MNKIEKLKQISDAGTTYKGDLPEVEMLKHFNALLAIAEKADQMVFHVKIAWGLDSLSGTSQIANELGKALKAFEEI